MTDPKVVSRYDYLVKTWHGAATFQDAVSLLSTTEYDLITEVWEIRERGAKLEVLPGEKEYLERLADELGLSTAEHDRIFDLRPDERERLAGLAQSWS